MRKSKTLQRIRNGETVRMCCLGHYIPAFVKHAAFFGYDCIWLDLEHRNIADRDVEALLVHSHLHDIDIMLRPRTREKTELYRYLEDGAAGLMIPHVNDPQTVEDLVQAVKYPPLGDRGLDGAGLDSEYYVRGSEGVADFMRDVNDETFLVVQIETPAAVAAADEIAAVEGLDGIFVGPGDLGLRIERLDTDLTLDTAFETVSAACKTHNVAWGCPVGTPEDLAKRQSQGGQLLANAGDFSGFMSALKDGAAEFDSNPRS
ncbi:MAG TPA: 4-hydroxy-2-oxovalerate aldolase [Planctomycetaceae bacterium]|nr:4-hydroxy-2-oxovalerate aldolase [Planctomycetaceae bacterium]